MNNSNIINPFELIEALASELVGMQKSKQRTVIAIAGAPASGKSTLAADLVAQLQGNGQMASLLPMDGFHLDNSILEKQVQIDVKGAPQTFDIFGFMALMNRIHDRSAPIYYPTFDRSRDLAIAGSGVIERSDEFIVVEGNYLLLDQHPWKSLKQLFDYTIFIDTDLEVLKKRLVQRWVSYGYELAGATKRALGNDIPNAKLVKDFQLAADRIIQQ